jgi:hypothetical protein
MAAVTDIPGGGFWAYLATHWYRWVILALVVAFVVYAFRFLRKRFRIVREFVVFLRERKLWWMTPMAVVFLLLACVIFVTEGSVIAPFIYMLF